jgi:uncharacterized protein YneF (UPF0154 family)
MGAAAFWIALAAILIAGGYFRSRREQMKHETIRRVIEKTGEVDTEQLKELVAPSVQHHFYGPPPQPWAPAPGSGFRITRVFATLAVAVGVGLGLCFVVLDQIGFEDQEAMMIGIGWAIVVTVIGAGLFLASRYFERPPSDDTAGGPGG